MLLRLTLALSVKPVLVNWNNVDCIRENPNDRSQVEVSTPSTDLLVLETLEEIAAMIPEGK